MAHSPGPSRRTSRSTVCIVHLDARSLCARIYCAHRRSTLEHIDGVVVSGAGPVGLVIALSRARAGIPVAVLEAEPAISDQPRAVVYHSPVVERLDALGLLADLQEIGVLKHAYHY